MRKKGIVLLAMLLMLVLINSVYGANITGRDIMVRVDNRDDGETRKSKMVMTLTNKVGDKRIREVLSYQKDYGKDSKAIMIFESPGDVKGTGYLSWEYDDESKEDNRWLYMPALRKIRRISGSSNDDYFMGTDFTYDDMGDRNVDEDEHTLLREEELDGEECWVIKSVPKEEDSEYQEKIEWVRKDIAMTIRVEYFNDYGLMKILKVKDIEEIDGIWTAKKMIMENQEEEHQTILEFSNLQYNIDLPDSLFRATTLKRGNIRY